MSTEGRGSSPAYPRTCYIQVMNTEIQNPGLSGSKPCQSYLQSIQNPAILITSLPPPGPQHQPPWPRPSRVPPTKKQVFHDGPQAPSEPSLLHLLPLFHSVLPPWPSGCSCHMLSPYLWAFALPKPLCMVPGTLGPGTRAAIPQFHQTSTQRSSHHRGLPS